MFGVGLISSLNLEKQTRRRRDQVYGDIVFTVAKERIEDLRRDAEHQRLVSALRRTKKDASIFTRRPYRRSLRRPATA